MGIVDEIKSKIEDLKKQLLSIQNQCSHPKAAVKEKPGASTGNWSRSDDSYWVDYHCTLCDKRWTLP